MSCRPFVFWVIRKASSAYSRSLARSFVRCCSSRFAQAERKERERERERGDGRCGGEGMATLPHRLAEVSAPHQGK